MSGFLQILVYGICGAASVALIGVSFGLSYRVSGFFNFAQAAFIAIGAYAVLFLISNGIPLLVAVVGALILCASLAGAIELLLFRPLRHRSSPPLVYFLVTLGTYVLLQNVISLCFGDSARAVVVGPVAPGYSILGARITTVQIVTTTTSAVVLCTVALILRSTQFGRSMRAVGSDSALADVCGISHDKVCLFTSAGTSALAGLAGILMGLDVDVVPTMGLNALMLGIVAAIIGGIGHISGLALAALLLSIAQNLGIWKIGSQWQDAIAFTILLVFLLFKPRGFSGDKAKSAIA